MTDLTRKDFQGWLGCYFDAWKSNDPGEVAGLFAEDAVYFIDPFREPVRGRDKIVEAWTDDPWEQSDQEFSFEAVGAEGRTGVAHWTASLVRNSAEPARVEMDGILQIDFDAHGRCITHREWTSKRETRNG